MHSVRCSWKHVHTCTHVPATVTYSVLRVSEADVPMIEKAIIQSTLTDVEFHFLVGDKMRSKLC